MTEPWWGLLRDDGFVVLRELVDGALMRPAKTLVEQVLATDLNDADAAQIAEWTARSFAPSIEASDELLDLYRESSLAALCGALLAPFGASPLERAQVQVRLANTRLSATQRAKAWHCDGVACPHLPSGTLNSFQLLVGVLLTDVPRASAGAVEFRLGGHLAFADFFRAGGQLGEGEEVPAHILDLPIYSFTGAAGDVVISHHMTPHAVGTNESGSDRTMVYFRVRASDHDAIKREQLQDPWIRMPALAKPIRARR